MSSDFLTKLLEWGEPLPAPPILRLWAGIGALSAILSRRVWIQANSRLPPLYPNLFIMLVAPPRVGKDLAINSAAALCQAANKAARKKYGAHILRTGGESISPKGLLDKLNEKESKQTISHGQEISEIHSLSFFVGEATTAIPEYDTRLIGIMNDLWNCKPSYGETIRGIEYTINNPHLMMLLGNQPDTLYRIFPEAVFKMGFTARVFFIYAPYRIKKKTYLEAHEEAQLDQTLYNQLINHLVEISQWTGAMKTTPEFRDAVNHFEYNDPSPVPGARFEHWNGGRCLNTQKLAMCLAASEGTQTITFQHWQRAVTYLFEAEKRMPLIFENVTTDRGFSEDIENIVNLGIKNAEITQYALLSKLARTKAPHEVSIIIDQAIRAGILAQVYDEAGAPARPLRYSIQQSIEAPVLLQ